MPAITASSPGKVILFGEHAVVYQRPRHIGKYALKVPESVPEYRVAMDSKFPAISDYIYLPANYRLYGVHPDGAAATELRYLDLVHLGYEHH